MKWSIVLHTAHARVTHGTQHAARSELGWKYTPNVSLHRESRVVASRVPFSKRHEYVWTKTPTSRKIDTWYYVTPQKEQPGNRLLHSRRKKNWSSRHAPHTARIAPKPRQLCPNGARTKGYQVWAEKYQKLTHIGVHICGMLWYAILW